MTPTSPLLGPRPRESKTDVQTRPSTQSIWPGEWVNVAGYCSALQSSTQDIRAAWDGSRWTRREAGQRRAGAVRPERPRAIHLNETPQTGRSVQIEEQWVDSRDWQRGEQGAKLGGALGFLRVDTQLANFLNPTELRTLKFEMMGLVLAGLGSVCYAIFCHSEFLVLPRLLLGGPCTGQLPPWAALCLSVAPTLSWTTMPSGRLCSSLRCSEPLCHPGSPGLPAHASGSPEDPQGLAQCWAHGRSSLNTETL